ncbi:hypothetical protein [Yonghaparkia sp. Soil809]|uniref:hypothetical protein n=1 Tax=Yonghaparkia sp. Soil809 TaxID=1736417 RepID=UPI0006F25438|nr:hypothetical protein [Yonghaparkia sp. Soil809]KRF32713.1 hypothetical protein ASG83_01295 [Yonghaparkia sp. Soil809]
MGERIWMLAQPLIAALALTGFAAATAFQAADRTDLIPSVQALITASFVYPGLALSMIVNQTMVMGRRPRRLTTVEKILVTGQFLIAGLLALTSLEPGALLLGFLLWPLLIVGAVAACWTMAGTTVRERRAHRAPRELGGEPRPDLDDHPGTGGVVSVAPRV